MFVDCFHKQAFDLRDGKSFFSKGVKLGFGQNLCQRCDTFNGCATGDKVVCPLASFSFFVVDDAVSKLLLFVLELREFALIFLAAKVIFCNEMYDIAARCGISYEEARRLWLADGRIGESHTRVFPDDRGYGGSCFPKDVRALLFTAQSAGLSLHQLEGTQRQNAVYHEEEKRV